MSRKTELERLPPAIVKSFLGEEKDLPFHKNTRDVKQSCTRTVECGAERTVPRSGFELRASSLVSYGFNLRVEVR